ncbi:uncharacterized protein LOC130746670 isoform X2 [Lotus japonicus]|uniref:uncharacterized protein LOC130746670 isoform X2 n=1 Tax=Lotus japonicus TaxID=34305 RepID=UPI0025862CCC|nr:uncharacterized protein LOC130746670 isoform X2 [Lotus japonicus]
MQEGKEEVRRDNVYESNGARNSGGFSPFGFGRNMMMPSLFGGRDPFDDPFFSDPFGSMRGPSFASRAMQNTSRDKGVVIQELGSDDEGTNTSFPQTGEPSVEHPDDDDDDHVNKRKSSGVTYKNDPFMSEPPKGGKISFQTSRVTYGGIDGAYYTSTRSRKIGADGVAMEESKEADSTTGQATHRITRGINDKGHSVLRKLDSDGKVDTMQTLHNLNEDDLAGFEEAWKGNNIGHLPGYDVHRNQDSSSGEQNRNQVWPRPSLEQARRTGGSASNYEAGTDFGARAKKVVRINIE